MYKECPSSSSSVQGVPKLVHRTWTNWALTWAHVYISKQFPSLVTLSVTAWTQLVHICEQVSFQVVHSNLNCCVSYPTRQLPAPEGPLSSSCMLSVPPMNVSRPHNLRKVERVCTINSCARSKLKHVSGVPIGMHWLALCSHTSARSAQ